MILKVQEKWQKFRLLLSNIRGKKISENYRKKSHFNIVSEASNVWMFLVKKSIKKIPEMTNFNEFLRSNSVTRQVFFVLNGQKLMENAKNRKFKNDSTREKSSLKIPKMINFGEFFF